MSLKPLTSADLNLLPVLQVLLEERNVTRAAMRLNLTQPAISRSLARLRQLFDDPLFTRTPKGLAPTPRAEQLSKQLRPLLNELSQLIEPPQFIPAETQRSFRVATTDYGTQVLLPTVLKRIRQEAPNVDLEIIPWHEPLLAQLDQADIDIALCTLTQAPAGIHGRGLGNDRFVCVLRNGHPLIEKGLDLTGYTQQPHALITMGGAPKGAIDYLLEAQGLTRRIAVRVPHFVAALALVAESDLLLTIPYGLAKSCGTLYPLTLLPFPMPQQDFTYSMVWHERHLKDPAHLWFRHLLFEELTAKLSALDSTYAFERR